MSGCSGLRKHALVRKTQFTCPQNQEYGQFGDKMGFLFIGHRLSLGDTKIASGFFLSLMKTSLFKQLHMACYTMLNICAILFCISTLYQYHIYHTNQNIFCKCSYPSGWLGYLFGDWQYIYIVWFWCIYMYSIGVEWRGEKQCIL